MSIPSELEKGRQLAQQVHDISGQLYSIFSGLDVHADTPAPPVSLPPAIQAPEVPTPAPVPAPAVAMPFPGEGSPELEAVIDQAALECGYSPAVVGAIPIWETGHYKSPLAGPWIHGNNPGGLGWNSAEFAASMGALPEPYVSTSGTHKYLKFATWQKGILGLGLFLARPSYAAGRAPGLSVTDQVFAIWNAGYSEKIPEWKTVVTALALKRAGAPTPVVIPHPADHVTTNAEAYVIRARVPCGNTSIYYNMTEGDNPDNPISPLPGSMLNGKRVCDCSEFDAWVWGYHRDTDGWNTDAVYADATGPQRHFAKRDKATPGICGMVFKAGVGNKHAYGHMCIVTAVDTNGRPTAIAQCHGPTGGPPPAIEETDPSVMFENGGIIIQYLGGLS